MAISSKRTIKHLSSIHKLEILKEKSNHLQKIKINQIEMRESVRVTSVPKKQE